MGKVIFPATQEMIFHELQIDSFEESDGGIYLLSDICTVGILLDHLVHFCECTLSLFDGEEEFFLKCWIRLNHNKKKLKHPENHTESHNDHTSTLKKSNPSEGELCICSETCTVNLCRMRKATYYTNSCESRYEDSHDIDR